jgi:cell division protein ZapA (FtsZ GTPase activity inhibitor)
MEKRQLRIDVLGTSLVVQADESPEHLARLASYVKAKVTEVQSRYSFAEPLTVALLAALNIADEMFKGREGRTETIDSQEIASVAQRILERMDDDLLEHTPLETDRPPHDS